MIYRLRNLTKDEWKGLNRFDSNSRFKFTIAKPQGIWQVNGNMKAWYPIPVEVRSCCQKLELVRPKYGYQLYRHCRTLEHVAQLFDVPKSELAEKVGKRRGAPDQCVNCKKIKSAQTGDYCIDCLSRTCTECHRPRLQKDYLCDWHRKALDSLPIISYSA